RPAPNHLATQTPARVHKADPHGLVQQPSLCQVRACDTLSKKSLDVPSSAQENPSPVHPIQNRPFHSEENDRCEQRSSAAQMSFDPLCQDADESVETSHRSRQVSSQSIHPNHHKRKRPAAVSSDIDNPVKEKQEETGPRGRQDAVRYCPHLH